MADSTVCVVDNATCSGGIRSRNLCNSHYLRWRRGGKPSTIDGAPVPELPTPLTLAERFVSKFRKSDGCWEWIGTHDSDGYGVIKDRGRMLKAHRLAYSFAYLSGNPIPSDALVCHRCDNPQCVRPDHLYLGDILDNAEDKARRLRGQRGESHHLAKLTQSDVLAIRADATSSNSELARKYGTAPGSIAAVRSRRSWRHVS